MSKKVKVLNGDSFVSLDFRKNICFMFGLVLDCYLEMLFSLWQKAHMFSNQHIHKLWDLQRHVIFTDGCLQKLFYK